MKLSMHKDFPKQRDSKSYMAVRLKDQNTYDLGFNDAISLLGELEVLELLDEKKVMDFYYNEFRKWEIKHTDIGDFIKTICQRFGTPAVGTGKQDLDYDVPLTGVIHKLKTIQPYFGHVVAQQKSFELRVNDRKFKRGDVLILQEYDSESDIYTGCEYEVVVYYILPAFKGLHPDWVILGIFPKLSPARTNEGTGKQECDVCYGIGDITIYKGQHPNIESENVPCPKCSSKFNSANVANFINILERTGKWNTLSPLEKGIYIYKEFSSPARSEVDETCDRCGIDLKNFRLCPNCMPLEKCVCKEWEENIGKIDNCFAFKANHGCGDYDGVAFKYCPWCGKVRQSRRS